MASKKKRVEDVETAEQMSDQSDGEDMEDETEMEVNEVQFTFIFSDFFFHFVVQDTCVTRISSAIFREMNISCFDNLFSRFLFKWVFFLFLIIWNHQVLHVQRTIYR